MTKVYFMNCTKKTKSIKVFLAFLLLLIGIYQSSAQALKVNEIMSSNGQTIADEDGDFEDWIELFNAGDTLINLQGYGLSDNANRPLKWVFPNISIASGEFLLIWASGKDRTIPGHSLHTNFSISAAGEPILISRPDGVVIDQVDPIAIPRDISYGRFRDGEDALYFFQNPSPGQSNLNPGVSDFLSDLSINIDTLSSGLYTLELNHSDPEAHIFYTLNGEDPLENGILYQEPFPIQARSADSLMFIPSVPEVISINNYGWIPPTPPFPGGTTLRAIATKENHLPSEIYTQTFLDTVLNFPTLLINIENNDFFDHERGIYVPGKIYEELGFNWENPWGAPNANYYLEGIESEREAFVQFLYPDSPPFSRKLGVRIHGSGSRAMPQKSLRFYARSSNGGDRIHFDAFRDGQTGYRRLIARNSGQDGIINPTLFRDAVIHRSLAYLNLDIQKSQPIMTFLNGEFWGLYNLRERIDPYYFEHKYGIPNEEIQMLDFDANILHGSAENYIEIRDFILSNDLSDTAHYSFVHRFFDVDNYIDYNIAQIFFGNFDWPGNNLEYWRRDIAFDSTLSAGLDGRWRWIIKDLDFGLGLNPDQGYEYDMMKHTTEAEGPDWPNPPSSTALFRNMLESLVFKQQFLSRFCDLMNTGFQSNRLNQFIDQYAETIAPFVDHHINRWNRPTDRTEWLYNISRLKGYTINRPSHQLQHLQEYFQLQNPIEVEIDVYPSAENGVVKINSVILQPGQEGTEYLSFPWKGKYFKESGLRLEALPQQGHQFSHWECDSKVYSERVLYFETDSIPLQVKAFFNTPTFEDKDLIYLWHFNNLENTDLEKVSPDFTAVNGGYIEYSGSAPGIMDRVDDTSPYFVLDHVIPEWSLRVRNPSADKALILHVPTVGYKDITFYFTCKRTNNGARLQTFWVRKNESEEWMQIEQNYAIHSDWHGYHFDLTDIQESNNNPSLQLRITFHGDQAGLSSGNNRFDNIMITGTPSTSNIINPRVLESVKVFPNPFVDKIEVQAKAIMKTQVQLSLVNASGQILHKFQTTTLLNGTNTFNLPVPQLPPGIYFLLINHDYGQEAIKIVKQ